MGGSEQPADDACETGRRANPRARIFLPAGLETLAGAQSVELRSLSCAGAMVAVESPPKVGSDLVLKCGAIDAFCTVVWAHDGLCGLKFEEDISDEAVLSARRYSDDFPAREEEQRRAAARAWTQGEVRTGIGD